MIKFCLISVYILGCSQNAVKNIESKPLQDEPANKMLGLELSFSSNEIKNSEENICYYKLINKSSQKLTIKPIEFGYKDDLGVNFFFRNN